MATINEVLKGLQIIAKYEKEDPCGVSAEHDIIYAGWTVSDKLSQEDRDQLEQLGWHWDSSIDSWARFV